MATTYRRAHTYTRNGRTFRRGGSKVNYNPAVVATVAAGGLAAAYGLSTLGLPFGAGVAIVGVGMVAFKYRKQIKRGWRKTAPARRKGKAAAKRAWRGTAGFFRNCHEENKAIYVRGGAAFREMRAMWARRGN